MPPTNKKNPAAVALGKRRMAKMTRAQRQALARTAAEARAQKRQEKTS